MPGRLLLGTAVRAAALLVGCTAASALAWLLARHPLVSVTAPLLERGAPGLASVSFEEALTAVLAAALLGCVLWLLATTALALASYVADELSPHSGPAGALSSLADRSCPSMVRQLVVAVLGVAVSTGAAGPALADASVPDGGRTGLTTGAGTAAGTLTGLALPDRTTGSTAVTTAPRARAPRAAPTVEVRPGDSLWSISAALLAANATDGQITRAWHRLHHANTARVGSDPDLIFPGTRLVVPDLSTSDRKDHS